MKKSFVLMNYQSEKLEVFLYFRSKKNLLKFLKNANEKMKKSIKGIVFGEEFCEHLIPTLKDVNDAYEECERNRLLFCFVTTVATNKVIKRYQKIFSFLNKKKKNISIIINDWGVLELLSTNYKFLEPILGRLLIKNKRYIYKNFTPDLEGINQNFFRNIIMNQLKILRKTNLSLEEYQNFLERYSIKKIYIDIPPQGINLENSHKKFDFGFYYPWGFLTKGRVCEYRNIKYVSVKSCSKRNCINMYSIFSTSYLNTSLLLLGNAVLYKTRKIKDILSLGFKRLIYEVDLGPSNLSELNIVLNESS